MKDKKEVQNQKQSKAFSSYAVYSGIAFQMIAIIGGGTYLGSLLDGYFETQKPILTAGLSLISVLIAIFAAIRQLLSISKKDTE
ncbi:MAG: AtpZ/AtpI family protein [Flavobacteriaceae bacterium]|nr:AtpZ/AtpI family protein [Flavobacteriaceae bacterium]